MGKFEDNLFTSLMAEHGQDLAGARRVSPRRTLPRPALVAGGAVVLGGAATAGVLALGGAGTPAYAVTPHSNGTMTVTIDDARAIDAANAKLRTLTHAKVVVVPLRKGCTDTFTQDPNAGHGKVTVDSSSNGSITLSTQGIPDGDTLVVGMESSGNKVTHLALAGPIKGKAPTCLPLTPPHTVTGQSGNGSQPGNGSEVTQDSGSGSKGVHTSNR